MQPSGPALFMSHMTCPPTSLSPPLACHALFSLLVSVSTICPLLCSLPLSCLSHRQHWACPICFSFSLRWTLPDDSGIFSLLFTIKNLSLIVEWLCQQFVYHTFSHISGTENWEEPKWTPFHGPGLSQLNQPGLTLLRSFVSAGSCHPPCLTPDSRVLQSFSLHLFVPLTLSVNVLSHARSLLHPPGCPPHGKAVSPWLWSLLYVPPHAGHLCAKVLSPLSVGTLLHSCLGRFHWAFPTAVRSAFEGCLLACLLCQLSPGACSISPACLMEPELTTGAY